MARIGRIYTGYLSVWILLICGIRVPVFAQTHAELNATQARVMYTPQFRVSLLTVGVGDEIYASFGHTGIRIVETTRAGYDKVFNYGTFDGFQESFELKFMRGKLLYYISSESFENFMAIYVQERRKVEEQVLNISQAEAFEIQRFLEENERGDNKYYKYDFIYDNCATRIRDVFKKALGQGFKYGQVIFPDGIKTYRQMINLYLAPLPWERLGINILLGRRIDKNMSGEGAMFLPDYLRNGMVGATFNGEALSGAPKVLLESNNGSEGLESPAMFHTMFVEPMPMLTFLVVLVLTFLGLFVKKLRLLGRIMTATLLVITGLLGCLILFMWFGTDHLATKENWNILWCLPTNLIVPFFRKRGQDRYAIIALVLLGLSLVLHLFHFQEFPLREVWPLWLALATVFGTIYRRGTRVSQPV